MKVILNTIVAALVSISGGCATMDTFVPLGRFSWGPTAEYTKAAQSYAYFLTSVMNERQGKNDLEIENLRRVTALAPDSATPTVHLMRAYLRKGDLDAALDSAKRAVEQDPERAELWIYMGELYHQKQDFERAAAAFKKAIELQPDDLLGYGALVELQESTNDLVAAQDIYRMLIERNPQSGVLHYQLGLNLMRMKDYDGAIPSFLKVIELEPKVAKAKYMLALAFMETGRNDEAAGELYRYVESRPDDAAALEFLGGALVRLGRYDEAADAFLRLIDSNAVQPKHHLQAAWVMLLAGRPGEATRLAPQSEAPVLAGVFNVLANRASGVDIVNEYSRLDAIEGNIETECGQVLGDLLTLFGPSTTGQKLVEMLRALPQGIEPSRVLTFVAARTLAQMEKYTEAVPLLEGSLQRFGKDRATHYQLSVCYDKLDNVSEAESHLKAVLEFDPGNPEVLNFLGYFYADHNMKLKEAEQLLKQALKAEPNNPYYLDSMGWVYYRMGHGKEALDLVRNALYAMDNDDPELRQHLGDIYQLNGDMEKALKEWRHALRLDPKLDKVRQKIEQNTSKK